MEAVLLIFQQAMVLPLSRMAMGYAETRLKKLFKISMKKVIFLPWGDGDEFRIRRSIS
jgi:hypothetical protein